MKIMRKEIHGHAHCTVTSATKCIHVGTKKTGTKKTDKQDSWHKIFYDIGGKVTRNLTLHIYNVY